MEKGRPRTFDKDEALAKALEIFWRNGYQGSSMADLTEAMGINKPSLYAAFGDKASLYLHALNLYGAQQGAQHKAALDADPDPRKAVRSFLVSVVSMLTSPKLPAGCFVVNGATGCGSVAMPKKIGEALTASVENSVALLRDRFRADCAAGTLPGSVDPAVLSHYFATVMTGLGVMAKVGVSRKKLLQVVEQAVLSIPSSQ